MVAGQTVDAGFLLQVAIDAPAHVGSIDDSPGEGHLTDVAMAGDALHLCPGMRAVVEVDHGLLRHDVDLAPANRLFGFVHRFELEDLGMIRNSPSVTGDAAGHLGNAGLLGAVGSAMTSTALQTGVDVRLVTVGEGLRRRRWRAGVATGKQRCCAHQQRELQAQADW